MSAEKSEQKPEVAPPEPSEAEGGSSVFSVDMIRALVELMHQHDLNEINLREGKARIQLRRGGLAGPVSLPTHLPPPAITAPPVAAAPAAAPLVDESKYTVIKSPMVGTFYAAPDPNSPPFVKVGDHVGPETTVCIIEAMKLFNEIPAECSGKIIAALVQNGEPVEYGQPLFRIDPNG